MSENKEETFDTFWNFTKKERTRLGLLKKICDVYGHDAVSVRVAQSWFKRFQSGNFNVKVASRSGRPITKIVDEIMENVEQDRHINSHDIDKD